jgi:hypothetical protein
MLDAADWGLDGAAHAVAPSLWMVRVETDGNGGLREVPLRPLTAEERRLIEARIAAGAPEPTPSSPAVPIPDLTDRILTMIERDGQVTRPAIETETRATPAQAHKALGRLRDAGRIRLSGHGPTARYVAR